jgi:endonuclease-8
MPEGDTVWLTARRLHQALAGRPLTISDLRIPSLATVNLRGQTVTEVVARGKHLLARLNSGTTLHAHLKMDGSWYVTPAGRRAGRLPDHLIRVLLGNGEWLATGYRIHDLCLVATSEECNLVGHLGPDLLGPDWDATDAVRRLAQQPERSVGEALLDQRNLAGIGNLYKSEVLFIERVNPWTSLAQVADPMRLVSTAHRLLLANREHPEQSTTGLLGRGRQHWVYERTGQACRRCRTPIQRAQQGVAPQQRSSYWCPTCQPLPPQPG